MASVFPPGILEHVRVLGSLKGNFFIDFTGTRFPQGNFPDLPSPDTRFTDLQTDGDSFHSDSDEWSALFKGFLCFNSESPVLMELSPSRAIVGRATELNLITQTSVEEILTDVVYEICLDRGTQGLTSET
jgi:hypothetical protein